MFWYVFVVGWFCGSARPVNLTSLAGEFLLYLLNGMHDECKWRTEFVESPDSVAKARLHYSSGLRLDRHSD